ncbi:MAG: hypothetical protein ACK5YS_04870, partial [bacterium]
VGQTIPGIPGSTHFRNRWVKSFPEFPSSQTIPAIGKVGQMISGIFTIGVGCGRPRWGSILVWFKMLVRADTNQGRGNANLFLNCCDVSDFS